MSEIFYDEVNGNKDTRSDFFYLKEAICNMVFLFQCCPSSFFVGQSMILHILSQMCHSVLEQI